MTISKKDDNFFTEFLKTSTIHGLRYLAEQSKIRYQRLFWFLLLSIVSCMFGVLFYEITTKFRLDQVIIRNSKRQYNISEILHPAMTICLEVKIFSENITEDERFYEMFNYINNEYESEVDMNTFMAELTKRTQFEWFTNCVFGYHAHGVVMPFSTILTKYGFCFSFNMQPAKSMFNLDKVSTDFHYNKSFDMKPWGELTSKLEEPPWKSDLYLDLTYIDLRRRSCDVYDFNSGYDGPGYYDPSIPQYDESNYFEPVEGIHVIVHSPDEYPVNSGQNLYLMNLAANEFKFSAEMYLIDDELKSWPLEKRGCYLNDEKKLIFFGIYTKNNCENECLSFLLLQQCGCVPFFLVRSSSTALCGVHKKTCVRETEENFHFDKGDVKSACKCYRRCQYVQFLVNARQSGGTQKTDLFTEFASQFFIPTVKENAFGAYEYLGSVGGLMGLFAGISVMSLFEVGFFIVRPFASKLNKYRNRKVVQVIKIVATQTLPVKEEKVYSRVSTFFFTIMNKSDIHGLRYIVEKNKNLSIRLFWLITVLVSSNLCFCQITDLVKHSEMNPIEYAMDQKIWDTKDVPFPQITFFPGSNQIKHRKHRICMEYNICDDIDPKMVEILRDPVKGPEELKPIGYISQAELDEMKDEIVFAKTGSYPNFGPNVLKKLKTFTFLNRFANQSFCRSGFQKTKMKDILTDFGASLTFNYDENVLNLEEVGKDFREVGAYDLECKDRSSLLMANSFSVNVIDQFDDDSCCRWTFVSFVIHNSNELFSYGENNIKRNTNTRVTFRPKITTSDESLRRYSPKLRKCYFSDEKLLKYFMKYSRSHCITEYETIITQEKCGCVQFSQPRNDSQRICSRRDSDCLVEITSLMAQIDYNDYAKSDCLPDCNSIDYNYEVFTEQIRPEDNSSIRDFSFSLSFYFGSDEFVAYKRFESYGTVGLLSNIGGLLGLFLGLSVLSVIETVYFFTLRFLNDLWCKSR